MLAGAPHNQNQGDKKVVNAMKTIVEKDTPAITLETDLPAFSKELAELTSKAEQPKQPVPEPPPRRQRLPVDFRAPYGWD